MGTKNDPLSEIPIEEIGGAGLTVRVHRNEKLAPGARVRVKIADGESYAYGCAAALEGKTGVVERVHRDGSTRLVAFDTPAPKWWSNQTPAKAFWFPPEDLEELPLDS